VTEYTLRFISYFRKKAASDFDQAGDIIVDVIIKDAYGQPVPEDGPDSEVWTTEAKARLRGPGDVLGFIPAGGSGKARKTIARLEPKEDCNDFEPNYFPFVEFVDPDFPWRYSLDPGSENRVMPWICLLVLSQEEMTDMQKQGIQVVRRLESHRETLTIKRGMLPRINELWASTHVQVILDAGAEYPPDSFDPADFVAKNPSKCCSRLFCMRKLKASTQYSGFIVPVYQSGLDAFLSGNASGGGRESATIWGGGDEQAADTVELPIYFKWFFSTGEEGDFEKLARRLSPCELKAGDGNGMKPVDMRLTLNNKQEAYFIMEGALAPLDYVREKTNQHLKHIPSKNISQMVDELNTGLSSFRTKEAEPKVTLPAYGCLFKNIAKIGKPGSLFFGWGDNCWANELNAEYRNRVAASIGTKVVQINQEDFVGKCLEWGGDILLANERLRLAKTAHVLNRVIEQKHIKYMDDSSLALFSAPFHKQLPALSWGEGTNLKRALANSGIPQNIVSPVFRRVTAQKMRAGRMDVFSQWKKSSPNVLQRSAATIFIRWSAILAALGKSREQVIAAVKALLKNLIYRLTGRTIEFSGAFWQWISRLRWDRLWKILADFSSRVFQRIFGWVYSAAMLQVQLQEIRERKESPRRDMYNQKYGPDIFGDTGEFRPQVVRRGVAVEKIDAGKVIKPKMDMGSVLKTKINHSIQFNAEGQTLDLDPILPCARVDDPMYIPLSVISQEYILPGIGKLENNKVAVCAENPFFIQSYMAGVNTAMSQEIVWRELPFNKRGTTFRFFWKPAVLRNAIPDIQDIHLWKKKLGENSARESADPYVVLLIKADLIRRYPDTIIYAVRINIKNDQKTEYLYWEDLAGRNPDGTLSPDSDDLPEYYKYEKTYDVFDSIFRAELGKGIVLIGFPVTEKEMREGQYYFILQEHRDLPRFGLDIGSRRIRRGEALGWGLLRKRLLGLSASLTALTSSGGATEADDLSWNDCTLSNGYIVDLDGTPAAFQIGNDISSATVAYRTYQKPIKVIMHSSRFVPEDR
jgi:hypothetical protein